jgi:hypothetical protein
MLAFRQQDESALQHALDDLQHRVGRGFALGQEQLQPNHQTRTPQRDVESRIRDF